MIEFDPAGDVEEFLRAAPAKWAVYLMADADDRPVQLLCVRNLRYSLKRRLGAADPESPRSKRVDYRAVVRKVHWRRVDSRFEADVVYLDAAREFFPQSYRGMTGFQPAWFVHVDSDAPFPRYTRTTDLRARPGAIIGPVEDKLAAGKLIEEIADWFDLCRYYNILQASPHGVACAYKEMGKCPAPCDGSISMEQYRGLVQWSAGSIVAPAELIAQTKSRMQHAAEAQRYESAAKIKSFLDSISKLGKGPLRHLRRLEDFRFVSLQRGGRDGTAKVFLITPGNIDEIAGLVGEPERLMEIVRAGGAIQRGDVDEIGAERIGVVTHHLFLAKATHGAFLPLEQADEKSLAKAFRDVQKQKLPVDDEIGEGVMKELQAL